MNIKNFPYGFWQSPITADLIASGVIGLSEVSLDNDNIYWLEMQPKENGRYVLVRRTKSGKICDVLPRKFNVRTRVHEYGGGSFIVDNDIIYFINFSDQIIYQYFLKNRKVKALTNNKNLRYADLIIDHKNKYIICVREDHRKKKIINTIVAVSLDGSGKEDILVVGNDFYSSPRLHPEGNKLAWITWNNPNMPWDNTSLIIADLDTNSRLANLKKIAGNNNESICQPQWSPDGMLYFISDRNNWWNIYQWHKDNIDAITNLEAEFTGPQWVFALSTYAFISKDNIICTYTQKGQWYLAQINTKTKQFKPIQTPYTDIRYLRTSKNLINSEVMGNSSLKGSSRGNTRDKTLTKQSQLDSLTQSRVAFIGGSPSIPLSVVEFNLRTEKFSILKSSLDFEINDKYISYPQAIEFPTEDNLTAHAFFYPSKNKDYVTSNEQLPPLIVISHGGPTASATTSLNFNIQYWTSRGIGVLDVNYHGSTGYGRKYRKKLYGQWGIIDWKDCINATKYLIVKGLVDKNSLAIRGSSAGGYTTLCALTFSNFFKGGASYYGISDLKALAQDTHKFEAHYLDLLIGKYPEAKDIYYKRSPLNYVNNLSAPVIFFQGLEDKVVPPNQAEKMIKALKYRGVPVAYVFFAGEQHGFRQAANIKRALDAELYFYSKIFSFF